MRGDAAKGLPAIQALALLLAAIAIDTLGVRRGLKSEYFIFTDPLIILAGAVLLDTLSDLRFHRWTYPIAIVCSDCISPSARPSRSNTPSCAGSRVRLRVELALHAAAAAAVVQRAAAAAITAC